MRLEGQFQERGKFSNMPKCWLPRFSGLRGYLGFASAA